MKQITLKYSLSVDPQVNTAFYRKSKPEAVKQYIFS